MPGHVGDEDVLTESELAILHGWAIGDDIPCFDLVADSDDWALVDAGTLVRTVELLEMVFVDSAFFFDFDGGAIHIGDFAICASNNG